MGLDFVSKCRALCFIVHNTDTLKTLITIITVFNTYVSLSLSLNQGYARIGQAHITHQSHCYTEVLLPIYDLHQVFFKIYLKYIFKFFKMILNKVRLYSGYILQWNFFCEAMCYGQDVKISWPQIHNFSTKSTFSFESYEGTELFYFQHFDPTM